jgi:phage antirepressor YoqD-like protein
MLPILQNKSVPTMSSREIADLTGKNHFDVKRDIQNVLLQAEIDASKFAVIYRDSQNRSQSEYNLPKRECDLVVSGYSVKYRLAIIDRWQELESQQSPSHILPQSFAEALMLAANQAAELERARPAVEFVDRYVQSTGNLGFRQVCKLLKAKENDFRAFLQDNRIMYRLGTEWTPYEPHIKAGRFHVSTGTSESEHAYSTAKFTPKGVKWVSELWDRHEYNTRPLYLPESI